MAGLCVAPARHWRTNWRTRKTALQSSTISPVSKAVRGHLERSGRKTRFSDLVGRRRALVHADVPFCLLAFRVERVRRDRPPAVWFSSSVGPSQPRSPPGARSAGAWAVVDCQGDTSAPRLVYLIVGLVVAAAKDYFDNIEGFKGVLEALIAISISPAVLLGVDINVR